MPNNDGENLDKAWAARAEAEAICDANWAEAVAARDEARAKARDEAWATAKVDMAENWAAAVKKETKAKARAYA